MSAEDVARGRNDRLGDLRLLAELERDLRAAWEKARRELEAAVLAARVEGMTYRRMAFAVVPAAGDLAATERRRQAVEAYLRKVSYRSRRNADLGRPPCPEREVASWWGEGGTSPMTRMTNPEYPLRRRIIEEFDVPGGLEGDDSEVIDHGVGGCERPLSSNTPEPTNDNE